MIEKIITFSIKNPFLVLMTSLFLTVAAFYSLKHASLDALPNLAAPQVIVEVQWDGQSPQTVQEQATYPIVSELLSIADIQTVRGFSSYANGMIYVIFKEGVDIYWARNRVMEQLASIQAQLPSSMKVALGPDASGVGWVYEYALTSQTKNLAQLRTLQDYYYKYALLGVDGVSEVATVGGFVPTYEVTIDNNDLVLYNLSINDIVKVLKENNNDVGGNVVIQNGYEWMIQAKGYLEDFDAISKLVVTKKAGTPITIGDIATLNLVPKTRRGLSELNGEGEVVGGIVMIKQNENAYKVLQKIHEKLNSLSIDDVTVTTTYDRSNIIEKAIQTLKSTLLEESLIVLGVIALFLMHFRSSLIVLIILPLSIGLTFLLMKIFGISSNIMSLGGIAIAIGTLVDASIVMIENVHKKLSQAMQKDASLSKEKRVEIILEASKLVGRPIFMALALVVISFLPIFALDGQEGLLFTPLAFTKTFAMMVGAILSITLVPVLILYFIKGKILSEEKNPLNRFFTALYAPLLKYSLKYKAVVLSLSFMVFVSIYPLYKTLNWEFMPSINEQSFMYMPVTPFGISIDESKRLLQKTDAIIKSFPEVKTVFGKAGRAETSTDPAPLSMLETIITLKPQTEWREGMSYEKLREELDAALQIPGLINTWTYPIKGRINMLLSGITSPVGIKLYGPDTKILQEYAMKIEEKLKAYENTESVAADRTASGYYIDIKIDEEALQQYSLSKKVILEYAFLAIGGMQVGTIFRGIERYPLALRLQEKDRTTLQSIQNIQIKTDLGFAPLSTFAKVEYRESPSIIKSEMANPVTFISITPKEGVSATEYKKEAQELLKDIKLPPRYYMEFEGESEHLENAMKKIVWIVPIVLIIILLLIYLALKEISSALIVFFTLPFALFGGLVYVKLLGFSMSVAVIVGFLALLGVAAATAIVMIVYLQESIKQSKEEHGENYQTQHLNAAVNAGALQRLRPKLMTVFAILAGLLPIMYSEGVGSEVMQRIAAPMIGGVISSAILSLLLIPVLFELYSKKMLQKKESHNA